ALHHARSGALPEQLHCFCCNGHVSLRGRIGRRGCCSRRICCCRRIRARGLALRERGTAACHEFFRRDVRFDIVDFCCDDFFDLIVLHLLRRTTTSRRLLLHGSGLTAAWEIGRAHV